MHVILEEAIEIPHVRVPERLGDLSDPLLWEVPKQGERVLQPHRDLAIAHVHSEPGDEVPLQPAQLDADLSRDHACAKPCMTMLRLDEVVDELYGIVERCAARVAGWQSPALLDLGDNLAFDGPDLSVRTSGHALSLKAESLRCPEGTPGAVSQRVRNLPAITVLSGRHGRRFAGEGDRANVVWSRTGVKHLLSLNWTSRSNFGRWTPPYDAAVAIQHTQAGLIDRLQTSSIAAQRESQRANLQGVQYRTNSMFVETGTNIRSKDGTGTRTIR